MSRRAGILVALVLGLCGLWSCRGPIALRMMDRGLARNLAARATRGRTIALAGFLDDKDVAAIGRVLAPCIDAWVIATLPPPRGLAAARVAERLGVGTPLALCATVADACAQAHAATRAGDRVVAFGSFHLVGPVLEWLQLY